MEAQLTEAERDLIAEAVEVMLTRPDSDDLAGTFERIIAARETALREEIAAAIERDHGVPFGVNANRSWPYRNGYYDGAMHAARIIRKIARQAPQ